MHQSSAVYRPSDPELWEFHQLWSLEHIMISEGREKAQQQWENRSKSSCSFFWVSDKESPSELGIQVQGWNHGVSRRGAIRPKKSKAKETGARGPEEAGAGLLRAGPSMLQAWWLQCSCSHCRLRLSHINRWLHPQKRWRCSHCVLLIKETMVMHFLKA